MEASINTIVIVGGVAGGMSAAARARRLAEDATIIVLERGGYVSFANCGLPYFVGGEIEDPNALILQTPDSLAAWLNLDVRLGHEVTGIDPDQRTVTVEHAGGSSEIHYDALILAPGAQAVVPPIPGIEHPVVSTLRTVDDAHKLREQVRAGCKRAVVIGGGFIGVEAAEVLAHAGLNVDLVEASDHIFPQLDASTAWYATQSLRELGIAVHSKISVASIKADGTVVLSNDTSIPADMVILAAGVRPATDPFASAGIAMERSAIIVDEHGATSVPGIWAVGDATTARRAYDGHQQVVALAGPANRAGRLVADAILAPDAARAIPTALGTAIARAGAVNVATTGMSAEALRAAGAHFHTVHAHPLNHAGYFPGAANLHMLVHFGVGGRILGAQAAGGEGVDKRIDVLATAIRAGLSIEDLIDLELAYAPPFGSAKDPVNFLGMIGQNVLQGRLKLWYPQDFDTLGDVLLLDVRTPEEHARGALDGAVNIPHTQVRAKLEEIRSLAQGRPVRVYCQSGVRSYLAHRILDHAGFDSASLSGGWLTWQASKIAA